MRRLCLGSHQQRLHRSEHALVRFLPESAFILVERALALNSEPRRPTIAASCLSSTSATRSPCEFVAVRHGRVPGGHHDASLSGGPQFGQATPLRSVRFAAGGLDRTAAPPGARKLRDGLQADRRTGVERIASSSKESRRYDPISRAAQSITAVHSLARRAIVATRRFERSFAHSLDRPHASYSRASCSRNEKIGLR